MLFLSARGWQGLGAGSGFRSAGALIYLGVTWAACPLSRADPSAVSGDPEFASRQAPLRNLPTREKAWRGKLANSKCRPVAASTSLRAHVLHGRCMLGFAALLATLGSANGGSSPDREFRSAGDPRFLVHARIAPQGTRSPASSWAIPRDQRRTLVGRRLALKSTIAAVRHGMTAAATGDHSPMQRQCEVCPILLRAGPAVVVDARLRPRALTARRWTRASGSIAS
jgi:hypothetical protein